MSLNHLILPNVKKIGIIRANALGDFIVILPALKALKNTYPSAEIILFGAPWHQQFLSNGRTEIDKVWVVPGMEGIRSEEGKNEDAIDIQHFIEQVKEQQFDAILNFQGSGIAANRLLKQLGAGVTAGVTCKQAIDPDRYIEYYYYQNEVVRYLEVAALIGATGTLAEPSIAVLPQDKYEAGAFPLFAQRQPYVVLHPVAKDIRRMWPIENYAMLADELRKLSLEVVFTGTADDNDAVEYIMQSMQYDAHNFCGKLSLGGLSAFLQQARVVIGADTGPLHLARAVNAPTIVFYWAPNLINWGPLTRSIHRPLVSWKMECPHCGIIPNNPYPFEPRHTCQHEVSFVSDITVDQVMEEVYKIPQLLQPINEPQSVIGCN